MIIYVVILLILQLIQKAKLMTRFLLLISLFTTQIICYAQISNDPAAKTLLDEVSAATDAHEAIYISFEYNLTNKSENIQENTDGELTLKKINIPYHLWE